MTNIRLTTVTDALGKQTQHYYDILGYTYRIVHPDGGEEWLYRDNNKNVVQHLHPDGNSDFYRYDERSNLLQHTRPDGTTVHFAWDDDDNLTGIRDPEGNHWLRAYDEQGNVTEETDPLGHKTAYQYNAYGQPVEITDAKGGSKLLSYTAQGQLASYTDCSGKTSSWQYDERGRLSKDVNAAGETTQYHYANGQLAAITHPDGAQSRFEYDAEGRLLNHTDPLGQTTRYSYTLAGLVNQRIDAAGQRLGYAWDALGRLVGLTNENGSQWRFNYDPVGRLLDETGFDNRRTQYHYDEGSGVLAHIDDNGIRTSLQFDAMGRLTERAAGPLTELDSEGVPRNAQREGFAYSAKGQLIYADNAASKLQWFYDETGNLTTEHQHYILNGQSVSAVWQHEYDPLGNRIATVRPDGHRLDWLTYGSGHIHGLLLDQQEQLGFERDDLHREIKRQLGSQLVHTQQYDPAGRLKAQLLAHTEAASQTRSGPLVQRLYQYDQAGQLTGIADSRRGSLSYRYDPVGRLLEANSALGKESFAFDPAGNLLDAKTQDTRSFQQDTSQFTSRMTGGSKLLDKLLRDYAGVHYHYDNRGNLSTRISNGQSTWSCLQNPA
ncbi:YD repeat-containing protein [Andreprevotia lacus DSM 23236]|jgi:YD repeat-containing protein|uniref:YD repeat-containing protein n=1 Tax=Andreprevotia lacus DSM 23236 TaxID=1121001 RepID=A0A1W1XYK8_9NEIS|nr:RHS repeat protein [Andreprevotia lacus]SMC29050.1 YD repeat-containing protein [Andreprevotia lacus DSM 23236]